MKKSKFLPTILGVAALASSVALPYNTFADSKTAEVKITVAESLSLTLSDNVINFDLSDAAFHSDSLTVTGATNNAKGYTISFGTNNDHNDLRHSNILVEDKIESVTEDKTEANFPATAWGVSTDAETFKQVPMAAANIFSTNTKGENDHTFTIGAKAAADMAAGDYNNELMFTIVANPEPEPEYLLMQDIADWKDTLELEQQIQVKDARDGKIYWVAKLADGNIWMTQNLDLDLSTTTTLTPADSDVTANWTPSRATIAGAANPDPADWTNNYNNPYSLDPGNYYFDGTYYESEECNYLTTTCDHFATTPYDLNGEHGHIGNYYNWSAAVASNDTSATTAGGTDMNSSICPKGWRLPHGWHSIQGNDFATLNTAYGGATDSDSVLLANPLFFVRGGYVISGYLVGPANLGPYWSSTAYSAGGADDFRFLSEGVFTSDFDSRYYGFSVRCLAR
ncbi:MAG: fibrobacter succinogenes major paralogous domain-containing protein [Candidatus Saccharibacteria bacterium]|nr:fibrobacter succinogenes major paralogous domain-containing protein [Candidatus Saccharibacteria bacterium]